MAADPGNAFRAFVAKGIDDILPGKRALSFLASIAINVALIAAVVSLARGPGADGGPTAKP